MSEFKDAGFSDSKGFCDDEWFLNNIRFICFAGLCIASEIYLST